MHSLTPPPKLSVVTITLNRRDLLREAIESVLAQQDENFEHIVVDGGSTDGTVELLRKYPHLRWISEPDSGQADAMNKAIGMVTGEIFAWLNSDDTFPPFAFRTIRQYFSQLPEVGFIYGRCNIMDQHGKTIGTTNFHQFDRRRLVMGFNNVNTPAVFVRADLLRESGPFDTTLRATYDLDMWLRITNVTRALPIQEIVSNLRLHQGSGLLSTRLHVPETKLIQERHWTDRSFRERFFSYPLLAVRQQLHYLLKFRRLSQLALR